jgi:hypothetical protein
MIEIAAEIVRIADEARTADRDVATAVAEYLAARFTEVDGCLHLADCSCALNYW